ncbi:MAG: BASS family bile acid:Na+ symporter, partial [Bradymonadia bacterium]
MSPENIDAARDIFVALLVVCVMLSVGFEMQVHQLRAAFKRPLRLVGGLTYEHIMVPLLAFGIATAVAAPPAGKLAVILCACTPGGPVGPAFVRNGKGDLPFAVTMVVMMAALNVVMTPLTLTMFGYADSVEGG